MSRLLIAIAVALLVLGLVAHFQSRHDRDPVVAAEDAASGEEREGPAPIEGGADLAPPERSHEERMAAEPGATGMADVAPADDEGERPLLLSGLVVDGASLGVAGADVHVARHVYDGGGFGMRSVKILELPALSTITDAGGRFEIRGAYEGDVVLRAEKDSYALLDELECTIPAERLTLVLERAGGVLVTITPDSAELAELVQLEVREPTREHDVRGAVGRFREGRCTRSGLSPGTYDVALVGRRSRRALVMVEGVQVSSGRTTEDPRLLDLDLRSIVSSVRITVVDPEDQPLDGLVWVHSGNSSRGERTGDDGTIELVAGLAGVDVSVREEGWRDVRRDGVMEDLVLRLEPSLRLRLVRPDGRSARVGDLYLVLEPKPPAGSPRTYRDQVEVTLKSDANEVEAALHAPGTYDLYWAVSLPHALGGTSFLHPEGLEPQVVEVVESDDVRSVTLVFDDAALLQMEERAAKMREELVRLPGETDAEFQRRMIEILTRDNR